MAEEKKNEATKAEATKAEATKAEAPKKATTNGNTSSRLAEAAARAKASAAKTAEATKEVPEDDLPPSGVDVETVEVYADEYDKPDDVLADADPTGLTDPNAFASSADPLAEVYVPEVTANETQAGVEIRSTREEVAIRRRPGAKPGPDRLAATYGVHSGKVGHSVPIVDDYTPVNPHAGGLIGGNNGPGAVGRVKAQQEKDAAAKALMENLAAGVGAQDRLDVYAKDDNSGKTAYKVVGGAIFTEDGKATPGQKVMLTPEEAKRFDNLGRLGPWID